MADKNLTNIQIYQKKTKYNIGVVLFGIIFIYLVITILAYVTNKKVSVYEVREGSILKDNTRVLFSETNRLSRQILMDM